MCCERPVRLYIAANMDMELPASDVLTPARTDCRSGDNIADRADYCELRVQYWVWKNVSPEAYTHVGFFHFRRYLDLSERGRGNRRRPYRIQKEPDRDDYRCDVVRDTVIPYDVIAPIWEYTGIPVWERYGSSAGHRREDLELVYQIIQEKYPKFSGAADTYLNGQGEYYGNIYIMRRRVFDEYCQWLFSILEEFERRSQSEALPRTPGYLAERLFGIWFTEFKAGEGRSWTECPRVHFWKYDDERHHFFRRRALNALLPPGTKRRAVVNKWLLKMRATKL